ncbi:hypothetical protein HZA97_04560 [Candidatus Woesearchaeota archaeon]|nr:hypothetical protein [Candidatus Woesearchaeota archaeon]
MNQEISSEFAAKNISKFLKVIPRKTVPKPNFVQRIFGRMYEKHWSLDETGKKILENTLKESDKLKTDEEKAALQVIIHIRRCFEKIVDKKIIELSEEEFKKRLLNNLDAGKKTLRPKWIYNSDFTEKAAKWLIDLLFSKLIKGEVDFLESTTIEKDKEKIILVPKEPEAKKEYLEKLEKIRKGKFIKVNSFVKRYRLE